MCTPGPFLWCGTNGNSRPWDWSVASAQAAPSGPPGPQMGPLTLRPEQAEQLGRLIARAAEPVRDPGVELGRLARLENDVPVAEHQPEPTIEDVEPVVALVGLQIGLLPAVRDQQLERLHPARPPGERDHRLAVPG